MRAIAFGLLVLAAAPAFAQNKSEEEAGDVSEVDKDRTGPLRDRVRPVSGHLFLMKGRFEISPEIGFSFRDSFYTKYVPGLLLSFHFTEELGVSIRGGYAISTVASAAQICTNDENGVRGCRSPTLEELDNGATDGTLPYGRMGLIADLNLEWAPLYGKLGTLAVLPFLDMVHFNMYVSLGPAFMITGFANAFPLGGNIDVGFRFFVNRFITVRLELRDLIYYEKQNTGSVRNQLMGDLGISFFLPTDFTRE
ncbi:MAG: outer membrane beta-barrel domain-containing protein [Archangiaceae bacterium]|nr:outer membrane beta-barrel domain-containing protein [Archangiaceae bacterium]